MVGALFMRFDQGIDMAAPRSARHDRRRTAMRVLAVLFGVALHYFPGLGVVDLTSARPAEGAAGPQAGGCVA